jgi:hypothetical protein
VAVPSSVRRIPSRNRGTNCTSCSNVIVTCIPAKSEMLGSVPLPDGPAVSVSTALHVAGTLTLLGPLLRIILRVCFLDPILRLLSDPILVRPLFRASTVACSHQLNSQCNEAYRQAFARRCFPLV